MHLTVLPVLDAASEALPPIELPYLLAALRRAGHAVALARGVAPADRDALLLYLQPTQSRRGVDLARREIERGQRVIALGPGARERASTLVALGAAVVCGELEAWALQLADDPAALPRGCHEAAPPRDLDALPWPCWDDFPQIHRARAADQPAPALPLLAARGEGAARRARSEASLAAELRWLQRRYGLRGAALLDGSAQRPLRLTRAPANHERSVAAVQPQAAPEPLPEPLPYGRRVFLSGGTGLLGLRVLRQLSGDTDGEVVALRRPRTRAPKFLRAVPLLWQRSELHELSLRDVEVVVHLASARPTVASALERRQVDVDGTAALLRACERDGVRRFIYVSCLETVAAADSERARRKREAEALVRASALDWLILRPSWILAPGGRLWRPLRLALAGRPTPLSPDADAEQRPLFVQDLAPLLARLAQRPRLGREVFELAGEPTCERELLSVAAAIGEQAPRFVALPAPLTHAWRTLAALRRGDASAYGAPLLPPLDGALARRALGFTPSSVEAGLRHLLRPPWPLNP